MKEAKTINWRLCISLVGQVFVMLIIAASWLPGIGSLIFVGSIGLVVMIILAFIGISGSDKNQSALFKILLFILPTLSLLSITIILALEALN